MSLLAVPLFIAALAATPENPIYTQLIEKGLPAREGSEASLKFPQPTMPDGLDAAAQRRVIDQIARPNRRVEDLLRDSIVAPFVLKIEDLPAAEGQDPVRRMDTWYLAYGDLDRFLDEDFFESLVDMTRERKGRIPSTKTTLAEDALRARGIEVPEQKDREERFLHASSPLFERVLVSATRHVVVTRGDDSVTVAAAIDPRFTGDAQYPNSWRSIEKDRRGTPTFGPVHPYGASGTYIKVTRLHEPTGALFVEHHQIFAEPYGWFEGKGLLRSKLPMAVQENVRRLRRELKAGK